MVQTTKSRIMKLTRDQMRRVRTKAALNKNNLILITTMMKEKTSRLILSMMLSETSPKQMTTRAHHIMLYNQRGNSSG